MKPKDFSFFALGHLLHKTLEDFHQALLDGSIIPQHILMAKFYRSALKEFGPKLPKEDIDLAYQIVDEYLKYLSEEINPPTILVVEKRFNQSIKDTVSLVGMIDRVQKDPDGVLHLLDYKTSKNMTYYENDWFQLQTYAYVMLKEDPTIKKIRCSYMFLRHNFTLITKEFGPDEIMEVEKQYIDYAEKIQATKEWKANPSFLCNYCGFLDQCDEGKTKIMPKITKNGEMNWS